MLVQLSISCSFLLTILLLSSLSAAPRMSSNLKSASEMVPFRAVKLIENCKRY